MPPVASTTARGGDHDRPGAGVAGLAQLHAGDRAVLGQQRFGDKTFDHADRRRLAHGFDQRRHDRRACHVAADMHDAARRMRGFAADREPAFEVAVEGNAVAQQIVDARGGFARESERDCFVDQAGADRDRIGGMRLGRCRPRQTAAAMPPCAQAVEAPSPSGAAEITVTGRGASFSAQNRPARPPPTMTTSSVLWLKS